MKEEAFTTFDATLVVPLGKLEPLTTRIASSYRPEFPVLQGGTKSRNHKTGLFRLVRIRATGGSK